MTAIRRPSGDHTALMTLPSTMVRAPDPSGAATERSPRPRSSRSSIHSNRPVEGAVVGWVAGSDAGAKAVTGRGGDASAVPDDAAGGVPASAGTDGPWAAAS